MMSFSKKTLRFLTKILPSPFSIAIILTLISFIAAYFMTPIRNASETPVFKLLDFWESGFWDLLKFGMQMMLMLVLGHTLALTKPIDRLIRIFSQSGTNTAAAAFTVTFFTVLVSFFNWGLGLIFGAVLARKTGEFAAEKGYKLNYPLIGAAGYSGLMVWHGGLSGSAPLKVAEQSHFLVDKIGVISLSETVFSQMNIVISITLIVILPILMYLIGKKAKAKNVKLTHKIQIKTSDKKTVKGAEKLDFSRIFAFFLSIPILIAGIYKSIQAGNISVLNLNYINFILFGLALLFHGTIFSFTKAVTEAVKGASGILIQFPLYAGIMGVMKYSGLTEVLTDFFVSVSNQNTFSVYTLISGGLVNIFVPSGGGQWAVQGPVITEAAKQLGVPVSKSVMALAYGDELTNMLQPFWALPLLAITGLKAKQIFPYTLLLMLAGFVIFTIGLLVF